MAKVPAGDEYRADRTEDAFRSSWRRAWEACTRPWLRRWLIFHPCGSHGAHVVGVDLSEAMLRAAQSHAKDTGESVVWCRASAESLPFSSESFDIIMTVTLLCFVKEPQRVVRETSRVLRSGGSLVIGELGRYSSWALSRRLRAWLGSRRWRDAHFWTTNELLELLEQAGLRVRASRGCVYFPPISLAAQILDEYDVAFSFLNQIGAAFLAIKGDKLAC